MTIESDRPAHKYISGTERSIGEGSNKIVNRTTISPRIAPVQYRFNSTSNSDRKQSALNISEQNSRPLKPILKGNNAGQHFQSVETSNYYDMPNTMTRNIDIGNSFQNNKGTYAYASQPLIGKNDISGQNESIYKSNSSHKTLRF